MRVRGGERPTRNGILEWRETGSVKYFWSRPKCTTNVITIYDHNVRLYTWIDEEIAYCSMTLELQITISER